MFVLFYCFFVLLFVLNFLVHLPLEVENALLWRLHSRTRCCIAPFLNSACTVAVVDSKVTEVRENFVEDECYQMATEFQETSLKPDISVMCT